MQDLKATSPCLALLRERVITGLSTEPAKYQTAAGVDTEFAAKGKANLGQKVKGGRGQSFQGRKDRREEDTKAEEWSYRCAPGRQ